MTYPEIQEIVKYKFLQGETTEQLIRYLMTEHSFPEPKATHIVTQVKREHLDNEAVVVGHKIDIEPDLYIQIKKWPKENQTQEFIAALLVKHGKGAKRAVTLANEVVTEINYHNEKIEKNRRFAALDSNLSQFALEQIQNSLALSEIHAQMISKYQLSAEEATKILKTVQAYHYNQADRSLEKTAASIVKAKYRQRIIFGTILFLLGGLGLVYTLIVEEDDFSEVFIGMLGVGFMTFLSGITKTERK